MSFNVVTDMRALYSCSECSSVYLWRPSRCLVCEAFTESLCDNEAMEGME